MWQKQNCKSSFRESVKALEADIQHANTLAAGLPGDYVGDCVQMKVSYSPFAPLLLLLVEWMDLTCTDSLPNYLGLLHILVYKVYIDGMPTMSSKERKASLREFYAVIYPWLKQLEGDMMESAKDERTQRHNIVVDPERDDECGICMDSCTKMVLPNCGHSLCICCFHDWNARSKSCPFCRGSLKTVSSGDLWVLTGDTDVVDMLTLAKENLRRFYLYMENLPPILPETHFILFDYMI